MGRRAVPTSTQGFRTDHALCGRSRFLVGADRRQRMTPPQPGIGTHNSLDAGARRSFVAISYLFTSPRVARRRGKHPAALTVCLPYIPMARGFVYLAAVIDWFSRKVLSWRISITMDEAVDRQHAGFQYLLNRVSDVHRIAGLRSGRRAFWRGRVAARQCRAA